MIKTTQTQSATEAAEKQFKQLRDKGQFKQQASYFFCDGIEVQEFLTVRMYETGTRVIVLVWYNMGHDMRLAGSASSTQLERFEGEALQNALQNIGLVIDYEAARIEEKGFFRGTLALQLALQKFGLVHMIRAHK
jgi:hypothetical protein